MSKGPSNFNRFSWHPLVPGLLLLVWIVPLLQSGWDFSGYTWFRWLGLGWMGLWFSLACWNLLTRGRFVESLYSDDDDSFAADETGEFVVPDSMEELLVKVEVSSPLVDLLRENLPAGKDLELALDDFDLSKVRDEDEAMAVMAAFRQLCLAADTRSRHLLEFFAEAGSAEAFAVYYRYAMPLVLDELCAHSTSEGWAVRAGEDDCEFRREIFGLLRVLTGYAYPAAFEEIVRAGQAPELHDSFRWGQVYDAGNYADEDYLTLIKLIGKELPTGFACVAYLDRCNELALEHGFEPHPFSSDAGVARLGEYLSDADRNHFSYAGSAATALAFIGHPGRDRLLDLGSKHPSPKVITEVAWAGAKLDRPEAVAKLVELSSDWRTGGRAIEFLCELGMEDRIAAAASEPAHLARCEMASWLEHPNELGELPDTVEVLDLREIFWPPLERRSHLAIVKWTRGEESGVGTTGGTATWCFFSTEEIAQASLDIYARHCNWQLRAHQVEGAPEDYNELDYGRRLLRHHNPDEDWTARPA